jgi:hypothetical protein
VRSRPVQSHHFGEAVDDLGERREAVVGGSGSCAAGCARLALATGSDDPLRRPPSDRKSLISGHGPGGPDAR